MNKHSNAFCCELTLTHDHHLGRRAYLAVEHSSQVQICVMEFGQLVTTCTLANLS